MTTLRAPDRTPRPDFDPDPLRDVEVALARMEWVTATHPLPGIGLPGGRARERMIVIGRILIVALSAALMAAVVAVV